MGDSAVEMRGRGEEREGGELNVRCVKCLSVPSLSLLNALEWNGIRLDLFIYFIAPYYQCLDCRTGLHELHLNFLFPHNGSTFLKTVFFFAYDHCFIYSVAREAARCLIRVCW